MHQVNPVPAPVQLTESRRELLQHVADGRVHHYSADNWSYLQLPGETSRTVTAAVAWLVRAELVRAVKDEYMSWNYELTAAGRLALGLTETTEEPPTVHQPAEQTSTPITTGEAPMNPPSILAIFHSTGDATLTATDADGGHISRAELWKNTEGRWVLASGRFAIIRPDASDAVNEYREHIGLPSNTRIREINSDQGSGVRGTLDAVLSDLAIICRESRAKLIVSGAAPDDLDSLIIERVTAVIADHIS